VAYFVSAGVGGAAGLLAGLGLLAIPGLGPVVAAGWLAATAVGAAEPHERSGVVAPEPALGNRKLKAGAVFAEHNQQRFLSGATR
jgi:hypothetical protein